MPASHSHTPTLRRHMNGQTNGNVSGNTKDTSFLHDNPSINLLQQQEGTREWEAEQRRAKDFYDDGTISFFWRAHRITVLILFVCALVYITLFDEVKHNFEYNAKRGLVAVVLVFVLFGVVHTPDGPFRRPHPAFWRLLLCTSVVYELSLVFLLFQTVDDARMLLKNLDPELGRTLPEKSYGGNCLLYDIGNPSDPYHNIWDKMDGFVAVHFFGWWLKTLILRDYWLCFVMSIMFEVLEYTLEHQLPNFSECWWDHWLMDGLICNTLGIYLGMMTLKYLSMKPYHWRGMWNIPSYTGKISRILKQFTPYCWTDFDWRPTSSLKRWLTMLFIISMFLLAELNTFYLKFVLWIPPPHFLCLGRLFFMLGLGAVVMREVYEFLDNPKCFEMAYQTWVVAAIIVTELLIVVKFDLPTVTLPLPLHIKYAWSIGIAGLLMYTIWHFYLKRLLYHTEQRISTPARKKHAAAASAKNNNNSKNVDHHDYYHRNTGRATTVQGHKGKHKH